MADLKTFRTRNRAEAYRRRQSQALGYPRDAVAVNGGFHVKASDKVPCINHQGLLRKGATEWAVVVDDETRAHAGAMTRLAGHAEALDAAHDVTTDRDDKTWAEAPALARELTDSEIMGGAAPEVRR